MVRDFCRRDYIGDLDWAIILAYLDVPETTTVMIIHARRKGPSVAGRVHDPSTEADVRELPQL